MNGPAPLVLAGLAAMLALAGCTSVPEAAPVAPVGHPHDHGADAGHEGHAQEEDHQEQAGADEHALHDGLAGDRHGAHTGMERPAFPEARGKVPASGNGLEEVSNLNLRSDAAFAPRFNGTGTLDDPYVITGFHVTGTLEVADTDACFVVKENYIEGQLALNWNGQCLHVHHNYVRDLRVNENVARTGYATGGLLEHNKIGVIGQLRHYDGEVRNNVVGPLASDSLFDPVQETTPLLFAERLVANIDGFNQGLIHHNTFYGSVDLDFHGHHHGAGFFAPHSHYHGDDQEKNLLHPHDHTDRWTSVAFTDNLIVDEEGYGLRYEDQNHAGDDRTANSETTEQLEAVHRHHTDIVIARNTVVGGRIWVDVFNAPDERHEPANATEPGTLAIEGNTVTLAERYDGATACGLFGGQGPQGWAAIDVERASHVDLLVQGNTLAFVPRPADPVGDLLAATESCAGINERPPAAVRLSGMDLADVLVQGNAATGVTYGVHARLFGAGSQWSLLGNDFGGAAAYLLEGAPEPRTSP